MREINQRKWLKNKFKMIASLGCALTVALAAGCSSLEQEKKLEIHEVKEIKERFLG
ncbi:hypothetical protein ACIQYL_13905 [Lysinibacillus xylanilyticus]|uniref:hypothetical protein n=1 Tax=Lysinibacillus xylanilyticus TaxID=582475 RepID=UPI003809F973